MKAESANPNAGEAETIFNAALAFNAAERAAYLAGACRDNLALRQRVEALLRAHEAPPGFLPEEPAVAPRPTMVVTPIEEAAGTVIGRYKLLQQIGEGGCGVVYMAEQQEPVRRRVALKVIKLGMDTKQVIARFEAERQALALMDHPNIAKVFDAGATETGRPYFVMELVKGIPITRYCDENNLSTVRRLGLFVQVCQAIQHAHQKGIIHRDIKPSNILVADHDGVPVPKIIDFGIAKATTDQALTDKTLFTAFEQFIGTPAYMSPEQARLSGLDIDTRSDIYSLGVLLYELLTGKTPFEAGRLHEAGLDEIRRIIREEEPPRPSTRLHTLDAAEQTTVAKHRQSEPPKLAHLISGDLDWIVMKALEKDRGRRYETANGLAMDIQRHLHNEPVVARPPSNLYRFQKMARRNKLAFAAAAAVAVSLILGLAISSFLFIREKEARANEATMRGQAEKARQQAQAEAVRAEAASLDAKSSELKAKEKESEAKTTLSASEFMQGSRLLAEGYPSDALAYLERSLSDNPANEAASTRLATILASHSWMVPTLLLKHGLLYSAQLDADGKRTVTPSWEKMGRVWNTQSGLPLIYSAQFSPDGKRLVTASGDMTAQVWDAQTGQPLTGSLKHSGPVAWAQFSPDGRRIVTASGDNTARVWDAQTGQPLTEPLQHSNWVNTAQFSPDGRRIVTASGDKTARVWDAQTGQQLNGPLQHDNAVTSAQFSPDGRRIVTACFNNTAWVWDAQSGRPLTGPLQHYNAVTSAQFSPDGNRIVTASRDATARVWDAQSGKPLAGPLRHGAMVNSAQFSPDGQRVVTASEDKTARVWDAQTGQQLNGPLQHDNTVTAAQFSPDGKRIVTASHDGTARVWDAQSGKPLTEPLQHGSEVTSAQFSPDGKRIVTLSLDGIARLWDARNGRTPLTESLKHRASANSAQFSPDGRRIVTASADQTARVWDAQSGQPMTGPLKHSGPVIAAEFSPDGKRIVTASGDGTARVWDAQTGQPLTGPLQHASGVNAAHFSPDGKRIVTASHDGTARLWDGQSGQPLTGPLQHIFPVVSAQFSPDGKWIVTGSADANARVWDAQSGQPLTELLQHGSTVNSAQFSPDGKRILTASHDGTARVLDAQSGQPVAALLRHNSPVTSAQFSPDGERIITAWGSTARVWNARSGQPLTGPMRHGGDIASAQFSPDGKWIATASADGTARIWDSQTGQPLAEPLVHGRAVNEEHINADGTKMLVTEMRWGVNSAQFSPDGKRVVTAAVDGTARVWDVAPSPENHPDWLPQLAEAISGQALNQQGLLVPTRLNRADVINQIRQELNQAPDQDGWVVWGRWFLADPTARTVSPFSRKTVPEYIDDRMQEKTAESLEEAERMAGDNEELLGRVAEARRIATEEALQKEAAQLAGEKEMAVRLADVVNLVDVVNPGEEQSETNHGFIGENVEAGFAQSGFAPGRSHRGSMQGGWFCYKVKVLPDKAALVVCTYRDVTSAPEKFDILVNGQRIATESFTTLDNRPAGFFYREYRIPEDMTQGLGHVTLKFRARPGQFTGQLLDIHILKAAE